MAPTARELHRTSSLHPYLLCALCGKRERRRRDLVAHLRECVANRTCPTCRIEFKNRGNLFAHMAHRHPKDLKSESRGAAPRARHACPVCPTSFAQPTHLKYHIRREHYDMSAPAAAAERRALGEVWLERVRNTDALVEISRARRNMYLLRRAGRDAALPLPAAAPRAPADLAALYPTKVRPHKRYCAQCACSYRTSEAAQHQHALACPQCKRTFYRPHLLHQHRCRAAPS